MPRQSVGSRTNGVAAICAEILEILGILITQLEVNNPELEQRITTGLAMCESCIDDKAGAPIATHLLSNAQNEEGAT